MYSVTELAKMFKTTRKTIYTKLNTENIQEYVENTKNGKRLLENGLSEFQLIMANSKISQENQNQEFDTKHKSNDYYSPFTHDYINQLKEEITELKKDKEYLRIQLNNSQELLKTRDNLLEKTQKKILLLYGEKENNQKNKSSWWKFWQ
jgi:ATP phosphoribosyltransferase